MQYEQRPLPSIELPSLQKSASEHFLGLPARSLDPAVDDAVFDSVIETWQTITHEDVDHFMAFKSRESEDGDEL